MATGHAVLRRQRSLRCATHDVSEWRLSDGRDRNCLRSERKTKRCTDGRGVLRRIAWLEVWKRVDVVGKGVRKAGGAKKERDRKVVRCEHALASAARFTAVRSAGGLERDRAHRTKVERRTAGRCGGEMPGRRSDVFGASFAMLAGEF